MGLKDKLQRLLTLREELERQEEKLSHTNNRGDIKMAKQRKAWAISGINNLIKDINFIVNPKKLLATFENTTTNGVIVFEKIFYNMDEGEIRALVEFMKYTGKAPMGLKIRSIRILDTKDDWSLL